MSSPFVPSSIPGGLGMPLALTGATAATRYVGATASGAPASGTFAVGDFCIDQSGKVFVCTAAGSPGTWTEVGAAAALSGAKCTNTAAITLTTAVTAALTWDTEVWDEGGYHSTASNTNRFVAPSTAKYAVSAIVGFVANATGIRRVELRDSGGATLARVDYSAVGAGGNAFVPIYAELAITAADWVEVAALQTSGGNLNTVAAGTQVAIHRLG